MNKAYLDHAFETRISMTTMISFKIPRIYLQDLVKGKICGKSAMQSNLWFHDKREQHATSTPSAGLHDWAVPLPLPGWLGCRCRTCTDWMTLRFNLWRFLGTSWKCSLFRVLDIPTASWTSKLETLQAKLAAHPACVGGRIMVHWQWLLQVDRVM